MADNRNYCIDRVLPVDLFQPQPSLMHGGRVRAIMPKKNWPNGARLRVLFMGGTTAQRETVRTEAQWWSEHANLGFEFGSDPQSEIRITFDSADGAWSYIGTDCARIPFGQPTMNLGFLTPGTAAHEFGHAIGLAHEHQNPAGGITWNEQVVIAALSGPPNYWTEEQIRHNVLRKYSVDQINGTAFDPKSIMLYAFPGTWVKSGIGTSANRVLSAVDKSFIASDQAYPGRGASVHEVELTVDAARRTSAAIGAAGEQDLFRFTVSRSGRHEVNTRGATDVVMRLYGPNDHRALIAEDDDSGYGVNARIVRDLVPGSYVAQVQHFRPTATGSYTIRVRRR